MLVLNRNERGEIILLIGQEKVVISVLKIYNKQPAKVRLGFDASENVIIRRREVHDAIERGKQT